MRHLLFFAIIFSHLNLFSQATNKSENDVFNSKEIVFYGYDFSHFKLAEAKRLLDKNIKHYIPIWINYLMEKIDEEDLEKGLKKEKVTFSFDYTIGLINSISEENLVSILKNTIPIDSLNGIIKNYDIKEIDGIGFVVIVESFEKVLNRCNSFYVFFDIKSKEILMIDYFGANKADGYGLSRFWGEGQEKTFKKYLSEVYRKKLNASKKQ